MTPEQKKTFKEPFHQVALRVDDLDRPFVSGRGKEYSFRQIVEAVEQETALGKRMLDGCESALRDVELETNRQMSKTVDDADLVICHYFRGALRVKM